MGTATRWRAIVDNDFSGDPDGLVSLAHVLLTDDIRVELVTCTPVDPALAELAGVDPASSASRAADKVAELLDVIGRREVPVVVGSESFVSGAAPSDAARAIAEAVMLEADAPLVIACGGPLTNIAAAIRWEPGVVERAVLVWIGGSVESSAEYNRDTDADAAAFVLGSGIPIVQVPIETYERIRVSIAEVRHDLATASPVGEWLSERLLDLPPFVTLHGVLGLGDSALAVIVGLDPSLAATRAGSCRRLVTEIDMRLLWGDLLAKLRLHDVGPGAEEGAK